MLDYINVKYFKYAVGHNIGKETQNDISSRCVLCGDSKDKSKKRLHLYTKPQYDGDIVHCFNCGFKNNMYVFLQQPEIDQTLYDLYVKEKRETSFNNLKNKNLKQKSKAEEFENPIIDIGNYKSTQIVNSDNDIDNINKLDTEDEPKSLDKPNDEILFEGKKIPPKVMLLPKEFVPASQNLEAVKYLEGRNLNPKDFYFSNNWIDFEGKKMPLANCIIIPFWVSKEDNIIYGFQGRSIKEKFFYTFIPEINTGWKVWNWFDIQRGKSIFIFESVIDALSSGLPKDRIASSLGIDLSEEREKEIFEPIYCLDNQRIDEASFNKSLELLQNNKKVFVWPMGIQEKDVNSWSINNKNNIFAKIILTNIFDDIKGILKLKLKK